MFIWPACWPARLRDINFSVGNYVQFFNQIELSGLPDVVLAQDVSLQAAKSLADLADAGAVETPVTTDHAAEVFEVVDRLQLGAHQLRWWVGGQLQ